MPRSVVSRPVMPAHPSRPATHTGTARAPRTRASLTPIAPRGLDASCHAGQRARPAILIATQDGVRFSLDGAPVGAGFHQVAAGTHHIGAAGRFVLGGHRDFTVTVRTSSCGRSRAPVTRGAPAGGTRACAAPRPCRAKTPARPSRGSARAVRRTGTGGAPSAAARPSRTVPADGTRASRRVSVLAAAADAPCGSNCLGPVIPTPASFRDDTCIPSTGQRSGATYTIPSTKGVQYWVNGANVGAGTYPAQDGMTLTVVVSARSGYTLSGITQWTHTFSAAPSCSGVSTAPKHAPPNHTPPPQHNTPAHPGANSTTKPAYTGAPVETLLLTASLLLLAGAFSCAVGRARRRPQATTTAGANFPNRPDATVGVRGRYRATRHGDRLASDPAAGSGRTPPRPGPAVGRRDRFAPPARSGSWFAARRSRLSALVSRSAAPATLGASP